MNVVLASVYAVCAFAVGFALGVVVSKLAQREKEKERQVKKDQAEPVIDTSVSILSSGDKVDVAESIKQSVVPEVKESVVKQALD